MENETTPEPIFTPEDVAEIEAALLEPAPNDLSPAPVCRFNWHGVDILGNEYKGSADTTAYCLFESQSMGAVTCHMDNNPDFIEPELPKLPSTNVAPGELHSFFMAGHEEGFRYFEDLKALVLAWATEQNLSGGMSDAESLPFITYCRNNP